MISEKEDRETKKFIKEVFKKEDSIEPSPSQTGGRHYIISESERRMFINSFRFIMVGLILLMAVIVVMGVLVFTVLDRNNYLSRAVEDIHGIRYDLDRIAEQAERGMLR